jgi:Tol biopolymer transport system component
MPASGPAEPTLFHSGATSEESYTTPFWSADGAMLYFGHSTFEPTTGAYSYWLERMDLQSGEITQVAENAFFPRLVSDGSKLIYLRMVPVTSIGDVVLSDPDGSNPQVLIKSDLFQAVDAPILTPDGSQIVFSAVGEPLAHTPAAQPRDWFAELFGVRSAKAHVTPSDLWIMPIEGGTPERLTELGEIGIVPVFSPDGKTLAFIGTAGVYVMRIGEWGPYLLAPAAANGSLVWK